MRGGAKGLLEFWQQQKEQGLVHVTINLKSSRRPADDIIAELGEEVVAKLNGVNLEKYRLNGRSNGIVIFRQSKNRLAFSPPTPTAQSPPNATLKLNLPSQMVWQARA